MIPNLIIKKLKKEKGDNMSVIYTKINGEYYELNNEGIKHPQKLIINATNKINTTYKRPDFMRPGEYKIRLNNINIPYINNEEMYKDMINFINENNITKINKISDSYKKVIDYQILDKDMNVIDYYSVMFDVDSIDSIIPLDINDRCELTNKYCRQFISKDTISFKPTTPLSVMNPSEQLYLNITNISIYQLQFSKNTHRSLMGVPFKPTSGTFISILENMKKIYSSSDENIDIPIIDIPCKTTNIIIDTEILLDNYIVSDKDIFENKDKCYEFIDYMPKTNSIIFYKNGKYEIVKGDSFIDTTKYIDNEDITKIIFGNDVSTIGDNVFAGCYNIENIMFSESIKKIGINSFGVTDNSKFKYNDKLKNIILPSSILSIGDKAFYNCIALEKIVMKSSNVEILSNNEDNEYQYPFGFYYNKYNEYFEESGDAINENYFINGEIEIIVFLLNQSIKTYVNKYNDYRLTKNKNKIFNLKYFTSEYIDDFPIEGSMNTISSNVVFQLNKELNEKIVELQNQIDDLKSKI